MMSRILIWGYGRLGKALLAGFIKYKQNTGQWPLKASELLIVTRKSQINDEIIVEEQFKLLGLKFVYNDLSVEQNDVVFASVPDEQIFEVAKLCDIPNVTLIHCSGSTPLITMDFGNSGVFYPLQTFAEGPMVDWSSIPLFLEANHPKTEQLLLNLSQSLGVFSTQFLPSEARETLHLSAVFANNFTVVMAAAAQDFLISKGLKGEWIQPILKQTACNLPDVNPWSRLTGPAKRGDFATINKHLKQLENDPKLHAIYKSLSEYIQERFQV